MSQADTHILVVDDDERIRSLLRRFLLREGFLVTTARDAQHARSLLAGLDFDLIVLDVMMPGEDGYSLTRSLRRKMATPILLLTAKGETTDRIAGLESGADDYLAKPFDPRELLLRIAAILRRVPASDMKGPKFLALGPLRFDIDKNELWQGDTLLRLTGTEQALLRRMAETPREPVSRADLIEDLGRTPSEELGENSERAIDVQITRLTARSNPIPESPAICKRCAALDICWCRISSFCQSGSSSSNIQEFSF